jgi:hypothetical protein
VAIAALWLLWAPLACNEPRDITGSTPAKQFTLHGVHIDEKRTDGTRWRGTAATSEGDLSVSDFTEANLTVTTPEARKYLVHSPKGTFDFDNDAGTFEETRVTDESGGVVHGGRAHYEGAAHLIRGEGPTRFLTPQMRTSAATSTIHLDTGTVDVVGPVVGRYYPGHMD